MYQCQVIIHPPLRTTSPKINFQVVQFRCFKKPKTGPCCVSGPANTAGARAIKTDIFFPISGHTALLKLTKPIPFPCECPMTASFSYPVVLQVHSTRAGKSSLARSYMVQSIRGGVDFNHKARKMVVRRLTPKTRVSTRILLMAHPKDATCVGKKHLVAAGIPGQEMNNCNNCRPPHPTSDSQNAKERSSEVIKDPLD